MGRYTETQELGRKCTGYFQVTSLATAKKIPGTGSLVCIQAEAQALRYRCDGVAPTAAVGMILNVGECIILNLGHDAASLQQVQIIEVAAGGIANITAYK